MRILTFVVLFVMSLFLLAACQPKQSQTNNPNPDMPKAVANVTWQWTELAEQSSASKTVVPDPENYTIVFQDDGKVAVKADCNRVSGTYKWDKEGLKIELGPSTKAMCRPDSLSQQFIDLLGKVTSGRLDRGNLYLETAERAQRLGFMKAK